MSAVSWLKRQPCSDAFANWLFRYLGIILTRTNFSLWEQHLDGNLNFVADYLSRIFDCDFNEVIDSIIYQYDSHNFKPSSLIYF